MAAIHILVVEDDERISTFIKRGLEAEGYLVDVAQDGQ
ncbi:MAG TPA: DNA-binding response regulator, partial [Nitrospira sp.]|nr:DNA-binding response regulator [Nitrospira sp.]